MIRRNTGPCPHRLRVWLAVGGPGPWQTEYVPRIVPCKATTHPDDHRIVFTAGRLRLVHRNGQQTWT